MNTLPLNLLLDYIYTLHTENMEDEEKNKFDAACFPEVEAEKKRRAKLERYMTSIKSQANIVEY